MIDKNDEEFGGIFQNIGTANDNDLILIEHMVNYKDLHCIALWQHHVPRYSQWIFKKNEPASIKFENLNF